MDGNDTESIEPRKRSCCRAVASGVGPRLLAFQSRWNSTELILRELGEGETGAALEVTCTGAWAGPPKLNAEAVFLTALETAGASGATWNGGCVAFAEVGG